MFRYLLKTAGLGILLSTAMQVVAQTEVIVKLKDNSEAKKYVVEEKGKLFFSNERLFLDQIASGAPVSFDLNSIQSVRFLPALSGNDLIFSDGGASFVYPNPATDNFFFANMSGENVVSVYTLDGALVLRQLYSQETGVSVAELPEGLYFVKVGNQTFKLEKK